MSQQAGWQAFHWSSEYLYNPWYSQVDPYFFSDKDLLSTRIMGEVSRLALTEGPCSLTEKLGREVAGPFYLSFMNWVLTEARKDNVRKILLLGRDGYYWEKSIKTLTPLKEFGVEVTYIHSSRKVLNFASFRTLDEEALSFLMVPNPSLTAKDFISRAGLNPELFLEKFEFVGFEDPEAILTSVAGGKFLDSKYPVQLRNLFMLLKRELEQKFAEDREGITALLEEAGFDSRDCAIVDIGWNASCLKALSRLKMLKQPECMRGYFFGTWSAAAKGPQPIQFKSFFVHLGMPDSRAKLIRESVNWLESINAAPFATLSGFEKVEGNISPRFEKNGLEGFTIDQQEELWKGASLFLEGAKNIVGEDYGSEAGIMYLEAVLNRLLREPSPEEARAWGDILHSEGFGIAAYTPLISDIGEETYGEDLMKAYWSSNWRRGFLTLLPEDKRQFVLQRAKPGKKKTVEQLEADLLWRQKQVDSFWNEKEAYKEEISKLLETNAGLARKLEQLKTDLNWKSGEAHALLREKEVLQAKLETVSPKPHQPESH